MNIFLLTCSKLFIIKICTYRLAKIAILRIIKKGDFNMLTFNTNDNEYYDDYIDYDNSYYSYDTDNKEDINIETIYNHIIKIKRIPPCDIEIMLPDIKILTSSNYRLRMNYIIDYLKKILEIKIEFIDNCSSIENV